MADENKTFMQESQEYADKYRAAIKEGYKAFMDVSTELIARGIKTKDQIIADARQFGLDVKEAAVDKALQVKGVVLDATGKVVQAGKDAKAWVDGKVQQGKDAVVQGYRDTRDAVRDGVDAAGKWVGDRVQDGRDAAVAAGKWVGDKAQKTGKAIRTGAEMGMGAVILGAEVTIKGVKKVGEKVGEKGKEVGRAAKAAKENAVKKAKKLWTMAKAKAKAARDTVVQGYEKAADWVEDKAETAAIGAMLAADKVKGKVEDVILDAGIAMEDARDWVADKAETAAIGAMLAADKVKDGARTVGAMGMGAILLGKDVAIKGVKKVGEKGQEIGRAAKTVKEQAVNKAKGLWGRIKDRARDGKEWVDGKVQAGKDAIVQGYRDTRDAVRDGVDAAGKWVGDRVQDGKDAVRAGKDAVVQGYRDTRDAVRDGIDAAGQWVDGKVQAGKDAIKDARTEISVRTDLGISSLQDGFASFFSGLGNRLAEQAISRKERAQQARDARDAEKNAVNKPTQSRGDEGK